MCTYSFRNNRNQQCNWDENTKCFRECIKHKQLKKTLFIIHINIHFNNTKIKEIFDIIVIPIYIYI